MIPATHHGTFQGTNRLWMMPGTPAHVSSATLDVTSQRLVIRWAHEGTSQEGSLVLAGPTPSCRGEFTDSFHAVQTLLLHGRVDGAQLLLYGTYPAGDGSPDWGWRVVLDWSDPEHFVVRMFNVLPDGLEALAVDLRAARPALRHRSAPAEGQRGHGA